MKNQKYGEKNRLDIYKYRTIKKIWSQTPMSTYNRMLRVYLPHFIRQRNSKIIFQLPFEHNVKFANFFPEFFRTRTLWSGLVVSHVFVVFAIELLRIRVKKNTS